MTPKVKNKLFKKHKKLLTHEGNKIDVECGDGWFKLIDSLCDKLNETNWDGNLTNIGKTSGRLAIYIDGKNSPEALLAFKNTIIKSGLTCETCGKPGITATLDNVTRCICGLCQIEERKNKLNGK